MRDTGRGAFGASAAAAAVGAACGFLVQLILSNRGSAPFVPPLSLPLTLALMAIVLVVFALRLRRALTRGSGAVNPFHAVRLLATARAGLVVGGLFGGFGGGLLLSFIGRSVPAPAATWLPMALVLAAGAALIGGAAFAERICRLPPGDDPDDAEGGAVGPADDRGPADQAAFRLR